MGPGHFPKLKIPLYQKAPAISYKPLSQLHTDDLVSFDLLYKAAIPFEQANKQTKKTRREEKLAFHKAEGKWYPRSERERLKQIKHAFWLCIINVTDDGKIEPVSQCEIKEVKQGTYSVYRMGRCYSWGFLLFL